MAKNRKTPDMNLPVWFDGQNINEALFCEEFLQEYITRKKKEVAHHGEEPENA